MHSQKSFSACVVVVVVFLEMCYGAPTEINYNAESKVVSYENEHNIDNYKFNYYTDYGISRKEEGELQKKGDEQVLVVTGSYAYRADGKIYTVTYVADENGYRAKVTQNAETAQFPAAALASLAGGGLG